MSSEIVLRSLLRRKEGSKNGYSDVCFSELGAGKGVDLKMSNLWAKLESEGEVDRGNQYRIRVPGYLDWTELGKAVRIVAGSDAAIEETERSRGCFRCKFANVVKVSGAPAAIQRKLVLPHSPYYGA